MICDCFCSQADQHGWQISLAIRCPSSLGKGAKPIAGRFSLQCLHLIVSASGFSLRGIIAWFGERASWQQLHKYQAHKIRFRQISIRSGPKGRYSIATSVRAWNGHQEIRSAAGAVRNPDDGSVQSHKYLSLYSISCFSSSNKNSSLNVCLR